jgi:hypothetical protein
MALAKGASAHNKLVVTARDWLGIHPTTAEHCPPIPGVLTALPSIVSDDTSLKRVGSTNRPLVDP